MPDEIPDREVGEQLGSYLKGVEANLRLYRAWTVFGWGPDGRHATHFLEVERSSKLSERLSEAYEGYYRYWKCGKSERQLGFTHLRVLCVAAGYASVAHLRDSAK
jgi:hypothetical protein